MDITITITPQLFDKKLMKLFIKLGVWNSVSTFFMLGIYEHGRVINPQIHMTPFKICYY